MTDRPDGGPAFPDARDDLAIRIMFKVLEADNGLYRDEGFLSKRSYMLADAMIAERNRK